MEFSILLVFSPLAARAFASLEGSKREEGAAVFNFSKTVGFSLGAAFTGVLMYRGTQTNWARYHGFLEPSREAVESLANTLGTSVGEPLMGAFLTSTLTQQAKLLTLVQISEVFAIISVAALPVVLLIKPSEGQIPSWIRKTLRGSWESPRKESTTPAAAAD